LPERWSAARKTELVLRLLRGEALDAVSRESQVPAHELRFLFADAGGGGAPSRNRLGTVPHNNDLWLGGHARFSAPYLTGQLRTKLEIATGKSRILQPRADDARQLRRSHIERGSQDALEQRWGGSTHSWAAGSRT